MIKLKSLINESMDVYVSGADDWTEEYSIGTLSSKFGYIFGKIFNKLSNEDQDFFKKNKALEVFAIDGNENWDSNTGIINFYINGLKQDTIKDILKGIKEYCNNINIKLGDFKVEQSGLLDSKVIRIPILKNNNEYKGYPQLNMANRNARIFFEKILGFDIENDTLKIDDVEDALKKSLNFNGHKLKSNALLPTQDGNMYDSGLTLPQLEKYVSTLKEILDWAKEKGFKEIYVA